MRPCKDEKAGEAHCVCSSMRAWSSQGSGYKAGTGRDKMGLDKMKTSLIGGPGGPLQGESRAAHPRTLGNSEGWQRKEPR